MRAVRVDNSGPEYRLVVDEVVRPAPRAGEVLIRVVAAGLNRADILQAQGRYPPPTGASPILGLEVAGEIVECGEGAGDWRPGDEVCALLSGGGYAQFCVAPSATLLSVPRGLDLMQAAALPEACFTVWTNLMESGRLAADESVLVHGGTSGIGTMAIQLCAALDHKVFTTAGSAEKCAVCESLGACRAVDYRREDFVEIVKHETGGRGVDVILDMVGGDYIERNFRALAVGGRLVNIAFQKGPKADVNFGAMLTKRLSFMATTLRARPESEKGRIRDAVGGRVWPLLEDGRVRPVVDRTFPLAAAQAAHERMRGGSHIGKILLAL